MLHYDDDDDDGNGNLSKKGAEGQELGHLAMCLHFQGSIKRILPSNPGLLLSEVAATQA